ncbi:MAG: UDP-glucose 6-dehydrogenase [Chlamydiae bacterium SM23_39]|nr:MAG: UDP-glucose 6-dehydrogenase [Chlamydiae bacterium SM23_39]
MKILIIGCGYVGLVTGVCFSEMGNKVTCLDIDKKKIENLKKGKIPIFEPGLEDILKRNSKADRLFFSNDYKSVKESEIIFFTIPTPSNNDGSCNLSYLTSSAQSVAKNINGYKILVIKSTVPVGSTFQIKKLIEEVIKKRKLKIEFDIVSNPEFLKEGTAILDCMKPDRIIIGSESKKATKTLKKLYSPFMLNHQKLIEMDILSSELTKYAANAMLATRISFMNELSHICKLTNANINNIRLGIGSDKRIGDSFLYAGIGYGGSCFPKDLKALCFLSKKLGYTPKLLEAVDYINEQQKKSFFKSIKKYFEKRGGLKGKTIAIWGLSFKPDTDDIRGSPSLCLIKNLEREGVNLKLYDPIAIKKAKISLKKLKNISWCQDKIEAAKGADGIALFTEWKEFRLVNLDLLKNNMKNRVFFDGRNQYNSQEMKKRGFEYIGIGVTEIVKNK